MQINMVQYTTRSVLPLRQRKLALALAILVSLPGAAAADSKAADLTTLPFGPLLAMAVYGASKFVQKSSQAPSTVTVNSAADIRSHGWRTLAAALAVSNLFDRRYADPGSAEHLQRALARDGRRLRLRLAYAF